MLKKNKQTASRNGKQEYLLTGLVKCAECGYAYVGHRANTRSAPRKRSTQRKSPLIVYRCSSHHDLRYQQSIYCSQGKIGSKKLESAVWSLICRVLLDPELVAEAVDRYFLDESNAGPLAQMQYLEEQICNREQENERIYKAYIVGAFDEHEFSARTHEVKARIANLKTEIATLRTRVMSINDAELKKRMLREIAKEAKLSDLADTLPFQKKKQIIRKVVERIELNQKEKWFTMTGVISGTHSFAQITNETTTSSEDGLVTKGEAIAMNVSANPENFSILDSSKQIPALAPVRYVSLGLSQ
ncbi:MAG: zinc ribbon domain-containing protein [Anaerolineae bacterium]|nr:zinc ribbon domain-containing protein [Anaerolineae bacterium]